MKILFVVGRFDDSGGRPSSYGQRFAKEFISRNSPEYYEIYNGGKFEELERIVFRDFDTIFWFADCPNDKPKLVREIKKNNPTCMLVTSKRNDDKKYGPLHLVARALQTKSNLLVEFKKNKETLISANILDPLGNCFLENSHFIEVLVGMLGSRLRQLRGFTRQPSLSLGEAIAIPDVPTEFFELVQRYAQKFHELIGAETERFLGNVSFRCKNGFPSFRHQQMIFVSKRNIDKRGIDQNGFVAVEQKESYVGYYGPDKPSVDTPIQLALYKTLPRINYMLHGHVYVAATQPTTKIVPCGALEEIEEIRSLIPADCDFFAINLRGHGSLCGAANPQLLSNIQYIARPLPEYQDITTF